MSPLNTVMLGALLFGSQLGEAGFFGDGNWHIGNWFSCTRVYKEKSSFHDSCVACVMAFCQVSCTCQKKNGKWTPTTHNALSCGGPGYMWNQDGRLTCHHDKWADWANHNPKWNRRRVEEEAEGTEATRVAERLEFAIGQPASVNATALEESVEIKSAIMDELIEMFAATIEEESPFVRHSIQAAVAAKLAGAHDKHGRFAVCELFELDDCEGQEMTFTRDEFEDFATRLRAALGATLEAVEANEGSLENMEN